LNLENGVTFNGTGIAQFGFNDIVGTQFGGRGFEFMGFNSN